MSYSQVVLPSKSLISWQKLNLCGMIKVKRLFRFDDISNPSYGIRCNEADRLNSLPRLKQFDETSSTHLFTAKTTLGIFRSIYRIVPLAPFFHDYSHTEMQKYRAQSCLPNWNSQMKNKLAIFFIHFIVLSICLITFSSPPNGTILRTHWYRLHPQIQCLFSFGVFLFVFCGSIFSVHLSISDLMWFLETDCISHVATKQRNDKSGIVGITVVFDRRNTHLVCFVSAANEMWPNEMANQPKICF